MRWYRPPSGGTGAAVLYLHGGGMIVGSVPIFDGPVSRYVPATGVPMLSVEYRLAPEHPHPTPVEDAYALIDAAGLPPAYIEVGQLDIFRDEDVDYALTLGRVGVAVELHCAPACRTNSTPSRSTPTSPAGRRPTAIASFAACERRAGESALLPVRSPVRTPP